ncbi:hypothetical protein B0A48_06359 [Cryoendolithus antarcticus]|uniref:Ubiquitin-like domain-containing protein n=1 Tax=Cryoendolithus antarcticus TaxID=1507870 RepID=A0A1V8TAV4_9PEZI|nr:hypothetical protein B0A48_06359 [Cryoendolithus antarcticus]
MAGFPPPSSATGLDVIIRFSTSNPDLLLPISHPATTSALSLKQLIRSHVPAPAATARLRLIHAGKVVPDTEALRRSLHARITPPPRRGETDEGSEKKKGKRAVRDDGATGEDVERARVYVHCSVGEELSARDTAEEADGAVRADAKLAQDTQAGVGDDGVTMQVVRKAERLVDNESTSTTPAPRGFDRLLTAGFTAAEVATLRSQFLSIQSHTHTPDNMPQGQELLLLEERWLETSNAPAATGGPEAEDVGGLDDLLRGTFTGFFWPMGAMFWLAREDGVWSGRRQACTIAGFAVNVSFGLFRLLS